jgi:predicted permease
MSAFARFPRRFRLPWRSPERIDREVDEEIAFHLDMRTDALIAEGVDPAEARARARREFGDVEEAGGSLRGADRAIEERRRRIEWLHELGMDLRFALRALRRGRGATLSAVLALGLGIGAATAVFSLVNWIELRPVPGVADPESLVLVQMRDESDGNTTGLSHPNLLDLRRGSSALRSLAGYEGIALQVAIDGAAPMGLMGAAVAGGYFSTLGLQAAGGRLLSREEEDSPIPGYEAVISHHLWRTLFGSDTHVAGRRIRLNGIDFNVVGVAPDGFRGTERLGETDVWVPGSAYSVLRHEDHWSLQDRGRKFLFEFVGRLQPGATPELAEQQLRATMDRLVKAYPEVNEIYSSYLPTVFPGIGLNVLAREHVRRTLLLMTGIVAMLLLIAWANVANLLLLRGVRRRGETAVRRALGASTARLLRSYLVEGVLLSLAGGAVGLLFGVAASRLFQGKQMGWLPEIDHIGLDWRVMGFVLGASLLSGAFFGMVPLWATQRENFLHHLKEASRTGTGRVTWLRGGLIVAQVTSATVLLVAALMLARTLHALSAVSTGFDASGVVAFMVDPSDLGYDSLQNRAFRAQLRERLIETPGFETVSVASSSPFSGGFMKFRLRPANAPDATPVEAYEFSASPEIFRTFRIPLLAGRGLASNGGDDEVVINRTLARQLFGSANPLGRTILGPKFGGPAAALYTVVGIVGDTRVQDLRSPEPDPVIYRPISALEAWRSVSLFLVRSSRPPSDVEATVRNAVAAIEPSLAIWNAEAVPASVADTISEERLLARMAILLAALAGLLAAVGLYAVVSYSVAQRTREIGIRMALGARMGAIVRLVSRGAAALVAAGIGLGTVIAVVGSRILENRLFGVERLDPMVYAAAAALFAIAAAAALWGPVRAAGGVQPTEALRQE